MNVCHINSIDPATNIGYYSPNSNDEYYFNINVINDPAVIKSPNSSDPPIDVRVGASYLLTVSVTDP